MTGISDTLSDTTASQASAESFTVLEAAPADSIIRGVAFAPVPEPASLGVFGLGLVALRLVRARRKASAGTR